MPKKPIDYSKGLIYRLVCRDIEVKEIYVGSTTDFASRKRLHKSDCHNSNSKRYGLKVYNYMREHGGWDNWDMILIEYFPCADEYELHARERHWIEHLSSTLNGNIPTRTHKEWRAENKETVATQQKAWKDENKEHISEWGAQYYLDNIDTIKAKLQAYRDANQEAIKAHRNESVTCECGAIITRTCKARHMRSKRHQNAMAALTPTAEPEVETPAPEIELVRV